MDAPERILVRAPTWVGDAVMATPARRALRAAHPGAEIAVESDKQVHALVEKVKQVYFATRSSAWSMEFGRASETDVLYCSYILQ